MVKWRGVCIASDMSLQLSPPADRISLHFAQFLSLGLTDRLGCVTPTAHPPSDHVQLRLVVAMHACMHPSIHAANPAFPVLAAANCHCPPFLAPKKAQGRFSGCRECCPLLVPFFGTRALRHVAACQQRRRRAKEPATAPCKQYTCQ